MRKSLKTVLAGCVSVLAAAALLVPGASPADATSSYGSYLYPLAGSSQYLVYSQSHSAGASKSFTGCRKGSPTLHVRDEAGRTTLLPVAGAGSSYDIDSDPCLGVSLNGSLLTMQGISGTRSPIYWWDLKHNTHGTVRLPANDNKDYYLGTVPGGWLFAPVDNNGDNNFLTATTLYRQSTGGKVTTFAKLPRFFLGDVVMSTRGVVSGDVVTKADANPLRYRRYGSSALRTLGVPPHKYGYNACDAVTATFVECHSIDENSENGVYYRYRVSITPLSGRATITSDQAFNPNIGTLVGTAAAPGGVVGLLAPTRTTSTLRGFGTGGRVSSAPGHGATAMTVAYGQIVVGHSGGGITLQSSVTGQQHQIL